jgi:hypothetical protein
MYLEVADIFWASVALFISTSLVITTAIKNWKLEQSRNEWRKNYYDLKDWMAKS